MKEKTIVLGFDGMGPRYLQKAMEARNLPNFTKLKQQGIIGTLKSCHPPTTIPAWQCMFTGKNPGKLGIFRPQKPDFKKARFSTIDFTEPYGTFIWDLGIKASLGFVPSISPPYRINGRIVEGPPGPKDFRTYPRNLKEKLINKRMIHLLKKEYTNPMDRSLNHFGVHQHVIHKLTDKYEQELLIAIYHVTDGVIHFGKSLGDFYDVYEEMDSELGYFLDKSERENANLFMVSDHGAYHTKNAFCINNWLEKHGYLTLTRAGHSVKSSVLRKFAYKLMSLGLRPHIESIYEFIKEKENVSLIKKKPDISNQINWNRSKAVSYLIGALPTTGLALNEEKLSKNGVEDLKKKLIRELKQESAVKWIKPREKVYNGDKVEDLPHLILRLKDEVMVQSLFRPDIYLKYDKYGHGYKGIFGAYGPKLKTFERYHASITDIAPTVLHSLGKAIPTNIDGKVLEDLFQEKRKIKHTDPINVRFQMNESESKEKAIKSRLKELGYLKG